MNDARLHLDNQLCFALYAASRAVTQAYQPLLAPLGVTYPQYLVLLVLWEERQASVKRLGERLHLDSGTLTPLLRRMAARGLITRERSRVDERVVEIGLTETGEQLQEAAQGVVTQLICLLGENINAIAALRDALKTMTSQVAPATIRKEATP
ncbi:MAG: MarR family transcriptional regulator [Candidatus Sericytochromatia bacterium]|nr:MarR family transcriptional regulator [Candidatus Sericytochromatia bacterium]